jgi:hypothetical protein
LSEVVGDKIFLAMSNLYFFNSYRGMQMDFSATFHPIPMLDLENVFPVKAAVAN